MVMYPTQRAKECSPIVIREASVLRKQAADREAALKKDIDQAKGAAAALKNANLSLEGTVAGLKDREAVLERDLRELGDESARMLDEVGMCVVMWGCPVALRCLALPLKT
ncbi:unnamed protein product [Ectocarpus sp. CCAP 1310/34]|nr:unnamed protein product [Ectocarpus sp. CCAP 1310/34]